MSCVGCNADAGKALPTCAQSNGLLAPGKSQHQTMEADVRRAMDCSPLLTSKDKNMIWLN